MKYLWIGVCLSDAQKKFLIDGGGKIFSGNISQDALISGLEKNGLALDTINGYKFPTYPKFRHKLIPEERWSRNGESKDVSVGYKNRKYFSHIYRTKALCREARKWAECNKDEEVTIFVYSMHSPFMSCAATVKEIIPGAKIVLIVPDLPQFMDSNMTSLKRVLKALDWHRIKKLMNSVDKYILYSKHMADFLGLKDGMWTVMEGTIDVSQLADEIPKKDNSKTTIFYSGVLDNQYGLPNLLSAFSLIKGNFELWLAGSGNAVPLIEDAARKDSRIRYLGYFSSRKDLMLKQKEASMLISVQDPNKVERKYCFPSKIFEYMISGNPVLSCRIGGIPDEYFNYLVEMKSTHPNDIKEAILAVAEMSEEERTTLGKGAREFVLNEKNNVAQAKKILEFIR